VVGTDSELDLLAPLTPPSFFLRMTAMSPSRAGYPPLISFLWPLGPHELTRTYLKIV
jgi:hypothetical protein